MYILHLCTVFYVWKRLRLIKPKYVAMLQEINLFKKSILLTEFLKPLYRAFHNVLRDYKHLYQENQRTYLNGIVHSHRKTENVFFFLTTRYVRCVHHEWHGTHRYDIQIVATHASTCWHVCGKNLNIIWMCAVSPVVHISNISSFQQKKLFQFSCRCEQFH